MRPFRFACNPEVRQNKYDIHLPFMRASASCIVWPLLCCETELNPCEASLRCARASCDDGVNARRICK